MTALPIFLHYQDLKEGKLYEPRLRYDRHSHFWALAQSRLRPEDPEEQLLWTPKECSCRFLVLETEVNISAHLLRTLVASVKEDDTFIKVLFEDGLVAYLLKSPLVGSRMCDFVFSELC